MYIGILTEAELKDSSNISSSELTKRVHKLSHEELIAVAEKFKPFA